MNLEDLHCFEGFVRPSGGSSKKAWLFALIAAAAGSVQIAPCLFARRSRPQLRSKNGSAQTSPRTAVRSLLAGLGVSIPAFIGDQADRLVLNCRQAGVAGSAPDELKQSCA